MVGDDIMTPHEASEFLGGRAKPISEKTLAEWRCYGGGPRYVKFGSLVRYRRVDLEAYMEERTQGGIKKGARGLRIA